MRPIPTKKHHWAVLVILAVVAVNTLMTFRQERVTGGQANMLAEVFKRQDPALYGNDSVFAETGGGAAWRLHLPAWQAVLAACLRQVRLGGPDVPLNALRLLGAATLLIYLLGMYVLLYRQTHSTSVATLVAVISTAIFSTNRPYWGLGPLFAVTPASLYLAAVPLLGLAFVRLRKRWAVLGVFFAAGLCGNIHLTSAINLTAVMFVALLGLGQLKWRAWAMGAASLAAGAVGAGPAIYHYYVTFSQAGAALTPAAWQAVRDVLENVGANVLYPGVLIEILRWLPVACLLAVPSAIILGWAGRYRAVNLNGWLWLLGSAIFAALALHGLAQIITWRLGPAFGRPPLIELFEALRLAMLPLYVLFAQATVHLLRMTQTNRAWVRAAAGLFAVVYLGSSYNTRPIRHMVSDLVADTAGQQRLRRHGTRLARNAELREIASWAGRHTPIDALFLTNRAEIRLYARRSLLSCPADLPYIVHLMPQRAGAWIETLRAQQRLLESNQVSTDSIIAFVDERCPPRAPTYILISARAAPPPQGRLKEISSPNGKWGRYWRLFRISPQASRCGDLPPRPTTAPATTTTSAPTITES